MLHACPQDPSGEGDFVGEDAVALVTTPYHLFRGGSDYQSTCINLFRSDSYARRLVLVPSMPPLPLLLLETFTRGTTGGRDNDLLKLVLPEYESMLDALGGRVAEAHGAAAGRPSDPEEVAVAVTNVLRRVAR